MSHIRVTNADTRVNFLASATGLITKTNNISATGVAADEYGYKIVPAGTVIPSNDENAKGILFEDVDVTAGDHEGALIIAGRIYEAMLPVVLDSDAKDALGASGIIFDTMPATTVG